MKTEEIISKMTLHEKISLCTGADMWRTKEYEKYGIKSVMTSDGPHGLRTQKSGGNLTNINESNPATCFPAAVTTGASWDADLLYEIGNAIGKEASAEGVFVVLGPGVNIKRNPLCGRNFEYFSEDPYISGKAASAFVNGLQSTGVKACIKHFAANNQEYKRMNGDSLVDARALREIYLSAFETAVKESHPGAVMAAYNKINNVHCSENKRLLTDILRGEWGFDGVVITDWNGMYDRTKSFAAGCDLNMPGGGEYGDKAAYEAVKNGTLDEERINKSVRRIIKLAKAAETAQEHAKPDHESHHGLALKAAEEGAVLLKNNGILPLCTKDVVLIGYKCEKTRHQGAGSSHINPTKLINIRDAMPDLPYYPCCDKEGNVTEHSLKLAAEHAKQKKIAVVAAGLPESYESESFDRESIKLPDGMNKMVEAVAGANPNTVVVLLGGGVMELPWADKVAAILYMGLPGQAGGEAVRKLLTGEAVPCGKLTESWPYSYDNVVCKDTFGTKNPEYRESVYVGYRYYITANVPVRYPFGHGLSYTSFEYSSLSADEYTARAKIKNTGKCAGAEVVQLYIGHKNASFFRPARELKGFVRVYLLPGQEKEVSFTLDKRSFAVWHDGWAVPDGEYEIMLGSSSVDIRLSTTIRISGEDLKTPPELSGTFYETLKGRPSHKEWETLTGGAIKAEAERTKGSFDMDSSCLEMKPYSFVMKIQYALTKLLTAKITGTKKGETAHKMMVTSALDSPMRAIVIHSAGKIKEKTVYGLLDMANGRFFRGLKRMMKKDK